MPKRPAPHISSGESHNNHHHNPRQPKKPRHTSSTNPHHRQKPGGFTVGPANLPDGTFRRKAQKIKKGLIHRAKLWKGLEKIKREEGIVSTNTRGRKRGNGGNDDDNDEDGEDEAAVRARRRMERAMQDDGGESDGDDSDNGNGSEINKHEVPNIENVDSSDEDKPAPTNDDGEEDPHTHPSRKQHTRRPRQSRYKNEISISKKVREVKAERERIEKAKAAATEKREMDRKARNKAMGAGRGAKTGTGQMKLGRQSKGLLEKVERMVKG
ncbi:hypothetical protein TWF225_003944 [Orbilia oligospora]|nr:hypothetical protein TWF225_003944 [Orbilia oligospora]KAF3239398.1 hypothetical protein TWF217_001312 [Orbilia oligospora]KAF3251587.1 hypothetical protein TWF128_007244 [Orbilia oligospora]KAF3295596.1 hypothetical protein TWF132_001627 [Orbilia oligospora]